METPFKAFGFSYECDGKRYSFDVVDVSEASAKRRAAAMSTASFVGELRVEQAATVEKGYAD